MGQQAFSFYAYGLAGLCIIGRINLLVVLSDIYTDMTIYINDRGLF